MNPFYLLYLLLPLSTSTSLTYNFFDSTTLTGDTAAQVGDSAQAAQMDFGTSSAKPFMGKVGLVFEGSQELTLDSQIECEYNMCEVGIWFYRHLFTDTPTLGCFKFLRKADPLIPATTDTDYTICLRLEAYAGGTYQIKVFGDTATGSYTALCDIGTSAYQWNLITVSYSNGTDDVFIQYDSSSANTVCASTAAVVAPTLSFGDIAVENDSGTRSNYFHGVIHQIIIHTERNRGLWEQMSDTSADARTSCQYSSSFAGCLNFQSFISYDFQNIAFYEEDYLQNTDQSRYFDKSSLSDYPIHNTNFGWATMPGVNLSTTTMIEFGQPMSLTVEMIIQQMGPLEQQTLELVDLKHGANIKLKISITSNITLENRVYYEVEVDGNTIFNDFDTGTFSAGTLNSEPILIVVSGTTLPDSPQDDSFVCFGMMARVAGESFENCITQTDTDFLPGTGTYKGELRLTTDTVFYLQFNVYDYFRRPESSFYIYADNPCKNTNKDCSTGTTLDIYSSSGCNTVEQTNFFALFPNYATYDDSGTCKCSSTDFSIKAGTSNRICVENSNDGKDYGHYECENDAGQTDPGCSGNLVQSGYYCSGGDNTQPDTCVIITCGDGLRHDGEECDDGDGNDGDGCSSSCIVEAGFTCTGGSPTSADTCSTPALICGDGSTDPGEGCDDGNPYNGDGCSNACAIEAGYTCQDHGASPDICIPDCGNGVRDAAEQCDDANYISFDGCSKDCNVESGWTCSGGSASTPDTCTRTLPQISVKIQEDTKDFTTFILEFDTEMVQSAINESVLSVYLSGSNEPYKYSISYQWMDNKRFLISIGYVTSLIKDDSETIKIVVNNPTVFQAITGQTLDQKYIFEVSVSMEDDDVGETMGRAVQVGILSAFISAGIANMIVGTSMEKMWSMINTCQLIFYLGLVSIYFPNHVMTFFSYLKLANMDNEFLGMLTQITIIRDDEDDRDAVNHRYSYLGYETISFLENVSDLVALCIIVTLVSSGFIILTCIKSLQGNEKCKKIILKLQRIYRYNALIRLGLEAYLDLFLACLIELYFTIANENIYLSKSFYIVVVLITLLSSFHLLTYALVLCNIKNIRGSKEKRQKIASFSCLFEEFGTADPLQVLYYPFFLLRRTIFVVALAVFVAYPKIQILLIFQSSALVFIYHFVYKPYKEVSINMLCTLNESLVMVCSGLLIGFLDKRTEHNTSNIMGWFFIGLVSFVLIVNWCAVVPPMVFKLCKKLYLKCRKKKKHTSPQRSASSQIRRTTENRLEMQSDKMSKIDDSNTPMDAFRHGPLYIEENKLVVPQAPRIRPPLEKSVFMEQSKHPSSPRGEIPLSSLMKRNDSLNGPRKHLPDIIEEDYVDRQKSDHISRLVKKLEPDD